MDIYILKNVPFKVNNNLNKRWDTYNNQFYLQVLNDSLFPKHISSKDSEINMDFENQIEEGK